MKLTNILETLYQKRFAQHDADGTEIEPFNDEEEELLDKKKMSYADIGKKFYPNTKDPSQYDSAVKTMSYKWQREREKKFGKDQFVNGGDGGDGPFSTRKSSSLGIMYQHNEKLLTRLSPQLVSAFKSDETAGHAKALTDVLAKRKNDVPYALYDYFSMLDHDKHDFSLFRFLLKWYANREFSIKDISSEENAKRMNKFFRLKQMHILPRRLASLNNTSFSDFKKLIDRENDLDYAETFGGKENVAFNRRESRDTHTVSLIKVTYDNASELAAGTIWEEIPAYMNYLDSEYIKTFVIIIDGKKLNHEGSSKYFLKSSAGGPPLIYDATGKPYNVHVAQKPAASAPQKEHDQFGVHESIQELINTFHPEALKIPSLENIFRSDVVPVLENFVRGHLDSVQFTKKTAKQNWRNTKFIDFNFTRSGPKLKHGDNKTLKKLFDDTGMFFNTTAFSTAFMFFTNDIIKLYAKHDKHLFLELCQTLLRTVAESIRQFHSQSKDDGTTAAVVVAAASKGAIDFAKQVADEFDKMANSPELANALKDLP